MWSEEELADKLIMMRDALSLHEQIVAQNKADPEAEEEIRKMMAEIFNEHYERINVNPEIIQKVESSPNKSVPLSSGPNDDFGALNPSTDPTQETENTDFLDDLLKDTV
mmetsp:Transcript_9410/g.14384  ORF Transcript_9410/g.14384 Transcript_9410/m.14384 type:complete len:109 (+) Transcript_9410:2687-3013(+)